MSTSNNSNPSTEDQAFWEEQPYDPEIETSNDDSEWLDSFEFQSLWNDQNFQINGFDPLLRYPTLNDRIYQLIYYRLFRDKYFFIKIVMMLNYLSRRQGDVQCSRFFSDKSQWTMDSMLVQERILSSVDDIWTHFGKQFSANDGDELLLEQIRSHPHKWSVDDWYQDTYLFLLVLAPYDDLVALFYITFFFS
ncbi:uncharacterized protein BX664DRAFT_387203 [Halteromyces radiatus]|uniref:uncharacterized protein n=1 Tax=Halteromyces radiatus TaxID=101107 RepID=UPI00221E844F|nr:uncharacterized protein BX664DRAFT_387203 [Halteromyces radiatus]KAI8084467.1 hypothetical protein BX664DRAFT_387203 [Halteromyces radiatus]